MRRMIRTSIWVWIVVLIAIVIAAAKAETYTATTEVYVRNLDGSIAGSLYTGDSVNVTGFSGGWAEIDVHGQNYRVWSEYLTQSDEPEPDGGIQKSKSAGKKDENGVYTGTVKKASIKGSIFEGKCFW